MTPQQHAALEKLKSYDGDWDTSNWNQAIDRCIHELAALSEQASKPVIAWVRRHPDGALTSEFLDNDVIEPTRKSSGAWVPLCRCDSLPAAAPVVSETISDERIVNLAADFRSTEMRCGVMCDVFDEVGFARAVLAERK